MSSISIDFPCIQNLASADIEFFKPWEFLPKVPKFKNKRLYKEWLAQESAGHCLYSGFLGVIPSLRVQQDANPIHSIHALVADYDAEISDDDIESMLDRAEEFTPNWVHTTPSGGARLVWVLSRPVLVASQPILQKTLKSAAKAMDLRGLLPGFDLQNAFLNATIYYDVGRDWIPVEGTKPLKAELVEGWMLKNSDGVKWGGEEIPYDILEAKLQEQFPGRWDGPFVEGARGVRFWDALADNPTAAIVRPTGMQCFTGPSGFVTWEKIFGNAFVSQFTAAKLGEVVEGIWYDGKTYWYQSADEKWEGRAEREMVRFFKVDRELSGDKEKGQDATEVEHALHSVDQHKRVAGAAPFVYLPAGMIEFMGKRVLNTARVKVVQPAKRVEDWGDRFPWLAEFFESFFDTEEQCLFFMCWLKRFYCSALEGSPRQGQALFIAGEAGRGKTLLSNKIISGLVGGHQDAAKFLLGESDFNKELFHHGLWAIDDATPGDNLGDHKRFSSLLKKVTANTSFEYHAKFHDSVMVEWTGRVIITGNLDAESLRILPDLDVSILDKIMLFKASEVNRIFPDKKDLEEIIDRELPYLAAWLVAFDPPAECLSDKPRYGVKSYHHPELRLAAGESTDATVLGEILESFIAERIKNKEPVPWTGTATALMQDILLDDVLKSMIGRNSVKWLSIQLGKLEAQQKNVYARRINGRKIYFLEAPGILKNGAKSHP